MKIIIYLFLLISTLSSAEYSNNLLAKLLDYENRYSNVKFDCDFDYRTSQELTKINEDKKKKGFPIFSQGVFSKYKYLYKEKNLLIIEKNKDNESKHETAVLFDGIKTIAVQYNQNFYSIVPGNKTGNLKVNITNYFLKQNGSLESKSLFSLIQEGSLAFSAEGGKLIASYRMPDPRFVQTFEFNEKSYLLQKTFLLNTESNKIISTTEIVWNSFKDILIPSSINLKLYIFDNPSDYSETIISIKNISFDVVNDSLELPIPKNFLMIDTINDVIK